MYDVAQFAGRRLYLDANVFIYAVEGFELYDGILKLLFGAIERRSVQVITSQLTLAEALVVPMRAQRPDLVSLYRELLGAGPIDVVPIGRDILIDSAAIRARSRAKPLDAIHIATAIAANADFFISDDRRLDSTPIRKMTLEDLAR